MRGKLFVYYRQKARERKKEISEKRKMAKQMQMKSIAEKGLGDLHYISITKIVNIFLFKKKLWCRDMDTL